MSTPAILFLAEQIEMNALAIRNALRSVLDASLEGKA